VAPVLNSHDLLKSAAAAARAYTSGIPGQDDEALKHDKSILVVEDSITARGLLKNILETAGYRVTTAVDGVDAWSTLRLESFQLVISDVEMPRMNGFDLTARIRADKNLTELPVLLLTALESREDRERGVDVGANAYIVKSDFDQERLLDVIRRLI
jgi:two-component system chemotaxis sensor kinase CheA